MGRKEIKYEKADILEPISKDIVLKFKDKIGLQINPEDVSRISFLWEVTDKDKRYIAKVCLTPKIFITFGLKPLTIIYCKNRWESQTDDLRKSVLLHELMHIGKKDERYVLYHHTVEDFACLLQTLGIHYEKSKEFFNK
jgi:predicted metallopeptidase